MIMTGSQHGGLMKTRPPLGRNLAAPCRAVCRDPRAWPVGALDGPLAGASVRPLARGDAPGRWCGAAARLSLGPPVWRRAPHSAPWLPLVPPPSLLRNLGGDAACGTATPASLALCRSTIRSVASSSSRRGFSSVSTRAAPCVQVVAVLGARMPVGPCASRLGAAGGAESSSRKRSLRRRSFVTLTSSNAPHLAQSATAVFPT
mmetsp:Transcript_5414/g.16216  ORF Transcript_5414/g.16216 Transcript_5414/m.16216 type:complete len:203 (+) Transcript_5414:404-1012(+)